YRRGRPARRPGHRFLCRGRDDLRSGREVRYSDQLQFQRSGARVRDGGGRRRGGPEGRQRKIGMTHRGVVTGWGSGSSIGHTAASYWTSLVRGVSGIAPATIIPTDQLTQKIVAEVKNFEAGKHFDDRGMAMLDRVAQFAVVAAREAVAHSGLSFDGPLS